MVQPQQLQPTEGGRPPTTTPANPNPYHTSRTPPQQQAQQPTWRNGTPTATSTKPDGHYLTSRTPATSPPYHNARTIPTSTETTASTTTRPTQPGKVGTPSKIY